MPGVITNTNVTTANVPGSGQRYLLLVGRSPIATTGVNQPVIIDSVSKAQSEFGTDTSYGNILPKMIEQAFSSVSTGSPAEKVIAVSVGANAATATTTTINNGAAIAVGSTSFDVTSATGIATSDVIVIDTGNAQETLTVASVAGTTITVNEKTAIPHADGVAVIKITPVSANAYQTALANTLDSKFSGVEIVVCDSTDATVRGYVDTHCASASDNFDMERYAIYSGARGANTTSEFISIASALGSDRAAIVGGTLVDGSGYPAEPGVNAVAVASHIISEENIAKPLRTIRISGYQGVLKTWSQTDLATLYSGNVCPIKIESGYPVLFEDVLSTSAAGTLHFIPQRRVADFIEKDVRERTNPIFGRENNSIATRSSLKNHIYQLMTEYAERGYILTGEQDILGAITDTTPRISVVASGTNRTQVDVSVDYWVQFAMRTIDVTFNLHN